ncbi:MAG: hypothetical protein COZ37_06120 [bacterium (Candidatus Ratteibacteria) CG_4_10_14_3_um_filter_41_18]|uniref:Sulfatase-modifying factor enzyme-like domain-containing protein n=2 Tax=Candidatus Ratteibacteria TaxID=2979319 RepID=A0A2M7M238_9BACT|nr:MAG: hypothetical protein COW28_03350 [bacterium (Candidatus Ratteibacteria) CG15_BIG_FIL_POST_REV_8_21_14_020_41_12]PIX76773.1 MAG: hypothetical protein COZ37_06120 [bacterium (Candidatus Ratteibacteria) CG_4_10_14_3_um_filter_41_18]
MVKYWGAKEKKKKKVPAAERKSYASLISTILSLALIAGLIYLGFYLNKRFDKKVSKETKITAEEEKVSEKQPTTSSYKPVISTSSSSRTVPASVTKMKEKEDEIPSEMVYVPAGEFIIGWDKENRPVQISTGAFYVDKYEVTNENYKKFIDATGHRPPKHPGKSKYDIWQGNDYPADLAKHPVVNVSWEDAAAYARWSGKRLPSEIEWEKAARGIDGRLYPWGNKFEENRCNAGAFGRKGTSPAGSYSNGISPYGCFDMAGNVWEWSSTLYDTKHKWHLARGGSWADGEGEITTVARSNPITASPTGGFRCVKDIE